ncbi:MAG: sugar-binding protein [Selenomonadaceae bacterium]|nr:sugar-binding protein [Selenomonadaceae bacterium]
MKYAKIICATLILIFVAALSGCGTAEEKAKTIAICFPNTSPSWERNGSAMQRLLEEENFIVDMYYAKIDSEQLQQFQEAVSKKVDCIVTCTVGDHDIHAENFALAKKNDIPIIIFDEFVKNDNITYYTSFDNNAIGEATGEYFTTVLNLRHGGGPYNIEFFSGTDAFLNGTMDILEPYIRSGQLICRSGQTTFEQTAVKDWNPENARTRIRELLNRYYTDAPLNVVISPNDDISGAIIEEIEKAGKPYPLISGLDGEPAAFQRIREGKQTFTIAKDPNILAAKCVRMIKAVVEGTQPDINDVTNYNSGTRFIPSYLCTPLIVDKSNIDTVTNKY